MNNQRSFFFNVDWLTVLLYLALCTVGLLSIHSAGFDAKHSSIFESTDYGKQALFILICSVLAVIILLLESRFVSALAPAIFLLSHPSLRRSSSGDRC